MLTRWCRELDPEHVLEDYPRPGMVRDSFVCLNGLWDYAITESSQLPDCRPWTPEDPVLYDLRIRVGEDEIGSYFAMRKISLERDSKGIYRLFLNNEPYFHCGILDQGYYPDGLYTPPSNEAMVNDILQMKALGFNMMRKHAKIEPDRWYYHCDRLGMLVWQDMVNGGLRYRGAVHKVLTSRVMERMGRSRGA